MGVHNFYELLRHKNHKVVIVTYDKKGTPQNVAIECENCKEVLLDYDK